MSKLEKNEKKESFSKRYDWIGIQYALNGMAKDMFKHVEGRNWQIYREPRGLGYKVIIELEPLQPDKEE